MDICLEMDVLQTAGSRQVTPRYSRDCFSGRRLVKHLGIVGASWHEVHLTLVELFFEI